MAPGRIDQWLRTGFAAALGLTPRLPGDSDEPASWAAQIHRTAVPIYALGRLNRPRIVYDLTSVDRRDGDAALGSALEIYTLEYDVYSLVAAEGEEKGAEVVRWLRGDVRSGAVRSHVLSYKFASSYDDKIKFYQSSWRVRVWLG